jgi:pimeloyl-ACP methyl ester carboxylesterase
LRDVVRAYPTPLLRLLADPSDSVVFPADAAFVREHGGANVAIEVFEGEGHTLHRTAFERFAASVKAFLTSP